MQNMIRRRTTQKIPRTVTVSVLSGITILAAALLWSFDTDPQSEGKQINSTASTSNWDEADDVVAWQVGTEKNDVRFNMGNELHSFIHDQEKGVRVIRFQLVNGGDEIVVNAETGEFIEIRPAAPMQGKVPAMPPMAAPAMPPMGTTTSMG